MQKQKEGEIEIFLYQNHIKIQSNLIVEQNISYEQFLGEVWGFAKMKFRLEIYSKDEKSFRLLTSQIFRNFLSTYDGQKININTNPIANNTIKIPAKNNDNDVSKQLKTKKTKKVKQNSMQSANMKISMKKKQKSLSIQNNSLEDSPIKSDQVESILNKFANLYFHQTNTKQNQILEREGGDAQKMKIRCSQCDDICTTPYFVCLVCKPAIFLCSTCQSKQDILDLQFHKFRQHPFAKIKRWTQEIKKCHTTLEKRQASFESEWNARKYKAISKINQCINSTLVQNMKKNAENKANRKEQTQREGV